MNCHWMTRRYQEAGETMKAGYGFAEWVRGRAQWIGLFAKKTDRSIWMCLRCRGQSTDWWTAMKHSELAMPQNSQCFCPPMTLHRCGNFHALPGNPGLAQDLDDWLLDLSLKRGHVAKWIPQGQKLLMWNFCGRKLKT
mmetsp:Transcript_99193/g.156920  ORF Transcript_99193/g.156920 Transcript_99193/m.156920 type:complete len:138 (-) Transcript_99193:79-492(-)